MLQAEHLISVVNAARASLTDCAASSHDHGDKHWRDVARVGLALWAEGGDCDLEIVFLFALLHDSQRHNEFRDPDHGARAAALAQRMAADGVLDLSPERMQVLAEALRDHDRGSTSPDPMIGTCWDADRLTLWRVGKTPDVQYLSTPGARRPEAPIVTRTIVGATGEYSWEQIIAAYVDREPLDVLSPLVPRQAAYLYRQMRQQCPNGELLPELADCLDESLRGLAVLGHPLVHEIYFGEQLHDTYNLQLLLKREKLDRALHDRRWQSYIWLHERPYRAQALADVSGELTADEFWDLAGSVWRDTENVWQTARLWRMLFEDAPEGRMVDDPDGFESLPSRLVIWRGTNHDDGMGSGMSWTLDRDKAEWFARRLARNDSQPVVLRGEVSKDQVLGYLTGRDENEIVVADPAVVENVTEHAVDDHDNPPRRF